MEDKRIQELFSELETYKQAIRDAQDALASCEKELDEVLDARYCEELKSQGLN